MILKINATILHLFIGVSCLLNLVCAQVTPAGPCPIDDSCVLPSCRCFSGTGIPGDMNRATIPQIVYLTFDDAINTRNHDLYQRLLYHRTNPNGASISATFFISHEYNDYNRTHNLYRNGHEIALHSISHSSNVTYWQELGENEWKSEIVDQRTVISKFAKIPANLIRGVRTPYYQTGDAFYKTLSSNDLDWESSRSSWRFRPNLWPYTADYRSEQDCTQPPCPIGSYPGFWTVPIVDLLGGDLYPCSMVDNCLPKPTTATQLFNLLQINFLDHYTGNKAPFGVFTTAALFQHTDTGEEMEAGYIQFLDYLASLPDVYIVSVSKALDWIRTPVPTAEISKITSWAPSPIIADDCPRAYNCRYSDFQTPHADGAERYMMSCIQCVYMYPWLNNPNGDLQF